MHYANGFIYPVFDNFREEPSATIKIIKKKKSEERVLLEYKAGKAIWRELASIAVKINYSKTGHGPLCLGFVNESDCDINGATAKIRQFRRYPTSLGS
jgi:hypothetical protein